MESNQSPLGGESHGSIISYASKSNLMTPHKQINIHLNPYASHKREISYAFETNNHMQFIDQSYKQMLSHYDQSRHVF